MRNKTTVLILIGAGLLGGIAIAAEEMKTSLDQIPAKAKDALVKLAGTAQITEVEAEKEHGLVLYEATWKTNGHEAAAKVTANGDLMELEQGVDAKDVPPGVTEAVAKAFPAGTPLVYEKTTVVIYEVQGKVNGHMKEIRVLPTGKLVGKGEKKADRDHDGDDEDEDKDGDEQAVSIDQVPAAVKATILAEAKDAPIKKIEQETKNGQTAYEAEWIANGQEIEIKVGSDGKVLKRETEAAGDDEQGDDDDDK